MECIVGITLALLFCGAAAWLGMGRERVFYSAVAIAVASLIADDVSTGLAVGLLRLLSAHERSVANVSFGSLASRASA